MEENVNIQFLVVCELTLVGYVYRSHILHGFLGGSLKFLFLIINAMPSTEISS